MKTFEELSNEEKGALLLAEFEGKTIECDSEGYWVELKDPNWINTTAYRIKLEPKTIWVNEYSYADYVHYSKESATDSSVLAPDKAIRVAVEFREAVK